MQTPRVSSLRLIQYFTKLKLQISPPSSEIINSMRRLYWPEDKTDFYNAFERNLKEMIDEAHAHGIPIVFGTVSYNYALPPVGFDETNPREISSIEQFTGASDAALRNMLQESPDNPYLEYAVGWKAYVRGDDAKARQWIDRSLLHDTRPHRATTKINEIIRKVMLEKNVPLADVYGAIVSQHAHHFPDKLLFDDQCHLNERGNTILQNEFADTIIKVMPRFN